MTKEELKQKAEEWVKDHSGLIGSYEYVKYDYDSLIQAYLASAEPREKEIKSLGERCLQLQKDKGNLTDRVNNLEEKLANADYQLEGRDLEIKELKAQIEKMKRCAICKHSTDLGYCKIRCSGGECDNHSSWEIKEND